MLIFLFIFHSTCTHIFDFTNISYQKKFIFTMNPLDIVKICLDSGIISYFSDMSPFDGLQLDVHASLTNDKVELFGPYENSNHVMGVYFSSRNYSLIFTYNGESEIKLALLFSSDFYSGERNMFPAEFKFPGFKYGKSSEFELNPILFDYGKQKDYLLIYIAASLLVVYIFCFWIKCCTCCCD